MNLDFPMGLLALGALGPLFVAYFLRRRQKPRIVSALFLWRTPSRRAQGGPRFERFSREASILLESAAIVTAALFLANLRIGKDTTRKHSIIILDGSLSMRAKTGGTTASERAVREVARTAAEDRADMLTIVESGPHPKVIAGPQVQTARALANLSSWRPSQPAHDFASAVMLAREIGASKGQRIRLFTDGPPPADCVWPEEVEVHSVGAAADNLAFLSAQRHDQDGVAQIILRVANFSKEKRTVDVAVSNHEVNRHEAAELAPGASAVVRFTMKTSLPLTARLPPDSLTLDSEIVLPPSPLVPLAVGVRADLDAASQSAVQRFLAITPGLQVTTEGRRNTPTAPTLTFGPPESDATVTLGARGKPRSYVGPFFAEKSAPLLEDVRLSGAIWSCGNNPPGRPLISMGDAHLMTIEDDGRLHVNLDLSRSNVQRTAAWPVLLANVVRAARLKTPGFARKMITLGEAADVVVAAQGRWELESPSGAKRPLFGFEAVRLPVPEGGEWTMLRDGRKIDSLLVLPLDGRESDLLTRGEYEVRARASLGTAAQSDLPRPRWLLGLLLVLLLVDFWLTTSPLFSREHIASRSRVSQ